EAVTWSPSSKRLAYVRIREATTAFRPVIETADLLGSAPRPVVDDQHLVQESGDPAMGWAPDGRFVYGLADWPPREPGTTLWAVAVDPDTGEVKGTPSKVSEPFTPVQGRMTISARGGLAFQRYVGQLDVYVAELLEQGKRMGKLRKISTTELDERPTGWSPRGRDSLIHVQSEWARERIPAGPRLSNTADYCRCSGVEHVGAIRRPGASRFLADALHREGRQAGAAPPDAAFASRRNS